jgi:hypothetical protein
LDVAVHPGPEVTTANCVKSGGEAQVTELVVKLGEDCFSKTGRDQNSLPYIP